MPRRGHPLGWPEPKVYSDNDISARSGKRRPALERLLADSRPGTSMAWSRGTLIECYAELSLSAGARCERVAAVPDPGGVSPGWRDRPNHPVRPASRTGPLRRRRHERRCHSSDRWCYGSAALGHNEAEGCAGRATRPIASLGLHGAADVSAGVQVAFVVPLVGVEDEAVRGLPHRPVCQLGS